jgi:hypothetical protein
MRFLAISYAATLDRNEKAGASRKKAVARQEKWNGSHQTKNATTNEFLFTAGHLVLRSAPDQQLMDPPTDGFAVANNS